LRHCLPPPPPPSTRPPFTQPSPPTLSRERRPLLDGRQALPLPPLLSEKTVPLLFSLSPFSLQLWCFLSLPCQAEVDLAFFSLSASTFPFSFPAGSFFPCCFREFSSCRLPFLSSRSVSLPSLSWADPPSPPFFLPRSSFFFFPSAPAFSLLRRWQTVFSFFLDVAFDPFGGRLSQPLFFFSLNCFPFGLLGDFPPSFPETRTAGSGHQVFSFW